ncbi:DUF4179 domain-containing protein [Halobacillus fulvus]|nr:DUF4179 domain-containing protein [Halobacillus fulvus]
MKKDTFEEHWDAIEVPEEKLDTAITKGITVGKKARPMKKRWKSPTLLSSAAASLILVSGFVFSPVTDVLAKVPLLHFVYDEISSPVGRDLFHTQSVTALNDQATSQDIGLMITSAYYDTMLIGITFSVTSDKLSLDNIKENGPESGYSYYLFDGDEQNQWAGATSELKETDDGFVGAIEFYRSDQSLGDDFTLPITFTSILGQQGRWKFDIPIEEKTPEKIKTTEQADTTKGGYSFRLNSITKGEATTILDYTTTRPKEGENDHFTIDVVDSQGNKLSKGSIGRQLNVQETESTLNVQERSLFTSPLDEKDRYIVIHPEVSKSEFDTIQPFEKTPFDIESDRFGYKIVVKNVQRKNQKLTIDYELENVERGKFREDHFQNFADQIKLIRSEDVLAGDDGQAQYEALKENSLILGKNGKIINEKELRLQSTFDLKNTSNFNLKDYSLMVPLGIFGRNDPIELDPIKVDLTSD